MFWFLIVSHERSSIIWLWEESKGFQGAFQVRVNPVTVEVEIWQSIGVQFTLLTEPDTATPTIEFNGIDGIEAGELLIEFCDDVFHGSRIMWWFLSVVELLDGGGGGMVEFRVSHAVHDMECEDG